MNTRLAYKADADTRGNGVQWRTPPTHRKSEALSLGSSGAGGKAGCALGAEGGCQSQALHWHRGREDDAGVELTMYR